MEQNNLQGRIDSTGAWPLLVTVCCGFLALSLDFLFSISSVLFDPTYLCGFGLMILEVSIVSALAGGVGLAAGGLLTPYTRCAQSMIRFLRLGRWLPFFVVWAAPIWWIRWSKALGVPLWTEPIFQLVIAMFPTLMFTACYYYLTARQTLRLNRRAAALNVLAPIVSDALLLAFILQVILYENGWQWVTPIDSERMARPLATVLLLGGLSFLSYRIGRYTFETTAEMNGVTIARQLRETNWISFWGAGILWALCFALWYRLFVLIRDTFAIAPPREVVRAAYRLLTTGSIVASREEPLWLDVGISSQELVEGLLLTGIVAIVAVKMIRLAAGSNIRSSWFFAMTHTVPIVLAISLMPWIAINHWFRATVVAAVSFLPFVQSLWGLRDQPLVGRILLALDNALPYAFVGMLFGQLYASTAGLGFLIVVRRAESNSTGALAISLITFGLMVAVSLILRFAAKKLSTSSPATT
jgi:ABC-type nitrate/sulfonate/bicarbonate transport system permease component